MKQKYDNICMQATNEWSEMVRTGKSGKGAASAAAVAARYDELIPEGCEKHITGNMLKNAYRSGRAGVAPLKPGPKSKIPSTFVKAVADFAQMQQVAGNEQKPRQLAQAAIASAQGTAYEHDLRLQSQRATLLRRVRMEHHLGVSASVVIDDRRWKWLTSTNMTVWFEGYVKCLAEWKFIAGIPDDHFEVIGIDMQKVARMTNGDESHQKLSNEGESAGPRSHVYTNAALGRSGKRKFEYQKHATILAWCSYAGEVGAPHLMLATDAAAAKKNASEDADESTMRIRPEWTFGVPRVKGKFGHPEIETHEPSFVLNEKGGMQGGGLEAFVEINFLKAYPNIEREWRFDSNGRVLAGPVFMQLDAGPDRYTDSSLQFRSRMWDKGLVFSPGIPNGTAANQLMDDLFGCYKTTSQQIIDNILSERMAAAALDPTGSKVTIDFCDLGRVINGRPEDPIELRPFARAFTPEKIRKAAQKLGLVPVDLRTALAHPRVRDDNQDGARTEAISTLQQGTTTTLNDISALGFNSTPLTVTLPHNVANPMEFIAPPSDSEARWKLVKAAGGCAGAHWAAVGARAFNAPDVVGPALERVQQKAADEDTRLNNRAFNFATLRQTVREIVEEMTESSPVLEYSDLGVTALKSIISYVFNARKETGASKVTGNKASCIAYLEANMTMDGLQTLIDEPPNAPILKAVPALNLDSAEAPAPAVLALTGPTTRTLTLDVELPAGLTIPAKPPDWLASALEKNSDNASLLVGKSIVYRWPARVGGWLVGKVVEANTDRANMVGDSVANFKVYYEADQDSAYHLLAISSYAQNSKSKIDAWALLA